MSAILQQIEEKLLEDQRDSANKTEQMRKEERLRTEEEIRKRMIKFNGESLKITLMVCKG